MKFFVPLLVVLVSWPATAADWRLSDALGDDRGVASPSARQTGWVLRIDARTGGQDRTLFHEGKIDSQRLVDLDSVGRIVRVRDLRDGLAIWQVDYDPASGLPTTETSFENGKESEVTHLEYQERVLVRRMVRSPEGVLLYTDQLGRWPDGLLRRLERDGSGGSVAESAWSYGDSGNLVRSWTADGESRARGEHRETLYTQGHTEETLANDQGPLLIRVNDDLGAQGSRETRTDASLQRVEKRLLDTRGRLVEEEVTVKGSVLQTKRWSYDDHDRVVQASTDSAAGHEVWAYEYSGNTTVGRLTRGDVPVREETSVDGEKTLVRLFDRGQLFLVETWSGGKRVKETYYSNNAVVRERTP